MEFGHGDGDVDVLERWLSVMAIGWVLDLADETVVKLVDATMRSWQRPRWRAVQPMGS
jgi:hypothetical protein